MTTLRLVKQAILPFIIALAAVSISGSAAFYSVTGLSKLFAGAATAVIIMASSLEISKLVIASLLYQYWAKLNALLKVYLTSAIFVLIGITSLGIYGFLSNAYQDTKLNNSIVDKQVELLTNKQQVYKDKILALESQIEFKQTRVTTLNELRGTQEARLDSLYAKNWYRSAKETEAVIADANEDIELVSAEINLLNDQAAKYKDTINLIEIEKVETSFNAESESELKSLMFMSALFNVNDDKMINILILIIIFVFDPLAISLVIAANFAFSQIKTETTKPVNTGTVITDDDSNGKSELTKSDVDDLGSMYEELFDNTQQNVDTPIDKKKVVKSEVSDKKNKNRPYWY